MDKRAWTARGTMAETDRIVIEGLVDRNRVAARIFVTGEVHETYIGDAAVDLLVSSNDVFYKNGAGQEPLFVQTKGDTVRMTRFDPDFVWRCFHPDILVGLVEEEAARLGVELDPYGMDEFDFYQSVVAAIKKKSGDAIAVVERGSGITNFYNAVYLSCLLLFGKPGYMDVPVAEHFAQPAAAGFLGGAEVYQLNAAAQRELEQLRAEYGRIQGLTNPEVNFVVDLYERSLV
jgi:hypothetical protein